MVMVKTLKNNQSSYLLIKTIKSVIFHKKFIIFYKGNLTMHRKKSLHEN